MRVLGPVRDRRSWNPLVIGILSVGQIRFFAAIVAARVPGWGIGRVTRFKVEVGFGLLIPGAVPLRFVAQCLIADRDFTSAGPLVVHGTVLEVAYRASNARRPRIGSSTWPANGATHGTSRPGAIQAAVPGGHAPVDRA